MTKKRLQKVMAAVYQQYGQTKTAEIADDLKDLGFKHATDSGISIGMGDFKPVIGLDKLVEDGEVRATDISAQYEQGFITDEERSRLTVDNWSNVDSIVPELLVEQMEGEDTATAIAIKPGENGRAN